MGKGKKQRVVTIVGKKGKAYQLAAAGELLCQGVVMRGLHERCAVHIKAYPPDRRKRDLDNLPKGVLDALTKAEVWGDDSQVDDLRITRGHIVKGGLLEITIQPMEQ
jgi:crossover junction endodeoxyribonuclease RusA